MTHQFWSEGILQRIISMPLWVSKIAKNALKMDTLREEYKCLESQLTESKRVEFADKELTQTQGS